MNILAVETTGHFASVALINEQEEIEDIQSNRKLSHLQNLVPMIDNLLNKCKLQLNDVTHLAVSQGPGSFTGIRIGIATVKALAQALKLPVIAVPTLRSMAWNVSSFDGLICPILDARRSQVYGGAYSFKDGLCMQVIRDDAYSIDDYLRLIDESDIDKSIIFLGDAIPVYSEHIETWKNVSDRIKLKGDLTVKTADDCIRYQKASSVAREAYALMKEGKLITYNELEPVYLRKAEAERKLQEKQSK